MNNSNNPNVFQNRSTIAKVVDSVLIKYDKESKNDYNRLLQFAIWGHRELQFNVFSYPKQIMFDMSEAKTQLLPNDFVKESVVAICIAGSYVALYADSNMCVKSEVCGAVPEVVRNSQYADNYPDFGLAWGMPPYYENGQYMGGEYGYAASSNYIGGYRITDGNPRKITFDSDVPTTKVYMEYMSTGQDPDGQTIIDVEQEAALRSYVEWQIADADPQKAMGEKDMRYRRWMKDQKNYRHLRNMFTEDEYLYVLRSHIHQLPKR